MRPASLLAQRLRFDAEGPVPLAWRNLFSQRWRFLRSVAGIGFAVLLMMVEIGFRDAFIDSILLPIKHLAGDIVMLSRSKYEFGRLAAMPRRRIYEARAVRGIAYVRPLYAARAGAVWKNPQDHRNFLIQVFAFNTDEPVFDLPAVNARLGDLRMPDTVLVDRRARSFLGDSEPGMRTELARRRVEIVGTFALGPDFFTDGTIMMGERNFIDFFPPDRAGASRLQLAVDRSVRRPDVQAGIVKVLPGYSVEAVRRAIAAVMPGDVDVLTKPELMAREAAFHSSVAPVGPVFGAGTIVGFVVGMLIAYQTLFSDISDQLSQYATLKAMGYTGGYLVRVVLQQAALYAALAYLPAWLLSAALFALVGEIALLPMHMGLDLSLISAGLTLVMCLGAALVAVRRVLAADPAEVF